MPKTCQEGELCGGTKHVEVEGGWEPCTCFYLTRRERWYTDGGFPDDFQSAERAIEAAGRKLTPDQLKRLAKYLYERPGTCLRFGAETYDAFPITAWLAYQLALKMEVFTVRVSTLVDLAFEERGALRRFMRANTALVIRGYGDDPRHSYNASILLELIQTRIDRNAPTLIAYTPSGVYLAKDAYGERVFDLLEGCRLI